jgi:hypothetical protein
MSKTFFFDELPDTAKTSISEGVHVLNITDVKEITASTGTIMIQFSYTIDDTEAKINMDNCPMITAEGEKIIFGQNKLKNILKAIDVRPKEFSARTLLPLVKGKKFKALLTKNEKGYLELAAKNIDSILSLEEQPSDSIGEIGEKEVVINTESKEPETVDKVRPNINW